MPAPGAAPGLRRETGISARGPAPRGRGVAALGEPAPQGARDQGDQDVVDGAAGGLADQVDLVEVEGEARDATAARAGPGPGLGGDERVRDP
ncbi:hypothetical protein GCM10020254_70550 [Streptomyces goshikiensis]